MKTGLFKQSLAVSLLALAFGVPGLANSATDECANKDAIITSEDPDRIADDCAVLTFTGSSPQTEANNVNTQWDPTGEDPFKFVGKVDFNKDGSTTETTVDGWTWTVTKLDESVTIDGTEYFFSFSLSGGEALAGTVVDFVLGLKDGGGPAGGGFATYIWSGVTLDIGGNFLSWFKEPFNISHASAFVRGEGVRVPEPATIALFGAGLLGLAWIRRRFAV